MSEPRSTWKFLGYSLLIAAVVAASGVFWGFLYLKFRDARDQAALNAQAAERAAHAPSSAAQERAQRQAPVAEVAPAALPRGLPLIARPGVDSFGYPRSYVDGPGLRALLEYGRYEELTAAFENFQTEFEADPRKENWPLAAAWSFSTALPRLAPLLDAWQQKTPGSFAPYLARGTYKDAVAWAERGSKWSKDTPAEDKKVMRGTAQAALVDLDRALELRPRLLAAQRMKLGPLLLLGDREGREKTLAAANAVCPTCLTVRVRFMSGLLPRWGGSYEAMDTLALEAPVAQNPALAVLAGFSDEDRSELATYAKDFTKALEFADSACKAGPYSVSLQNRARVRWHLNQLDQALADLDQAVDLRPDRADLRIERAGLLAEQKKWRLAADDLIAGLRVDTTSDAGRRSLPSVYHGLLEEADRAAALHERDHAIELYELVEALYPFARDVQRKRSAVIIDGMTGTPEEIAQLEKALVDAPDDFNGHLRFDYVAAQKVGYPRIIEMWTKYIERHPEDVRAYFERSGAYFNSGHREEVRADLTRACQGGNSGACGILHNMAPPSSSPP